MVVSGDLLRGNMNKKFTIEACSDCDFEGMVVDVCYDMETIASINYDKGIDNLEIRLSDSLYTKGNIGFPLEIFLQVLEKAKKIATRYAKEDSEG